MTRTGFNLAGGIALVAVFIGLGSSAARAELQISVYTGGNFTHDSDVKIVRPGGTNVTFGGVPWAAMPFESPLYYGGRVTYWFDQAPNFGLGVDFTHFKTYAKLGSTVAAAGTIAGAPPPPSVVLGNQFTRLEFSDGLNLLTAHVFYRYPLGRWTPYAGIGLGASIPHVEVSMPGFPNTFRYEVTGLAARLYAGLQVQVHGGWSVFGEYQFSYAQIDNAGLGGRGTLDTNIRSHHVNFGVSYAFRPS
jgi:lipid A oxidase